MPFVGTVSVLGMDSFFSGEVHGVIDTTPVEHSEFVCHQETSCDLDFMADLKVLRSYLVAAHEVLGALMICISMKVECLAVSHCGDLPCNLLTQGLSGFVQAPEVAFK